MQSLNQTFEINKMKSIILAATLTLIIKGSMAFGQNKTMSDKKDAKTAKTDQPKDSVYYGCVLCCQACSIFRTDKPGECPTCGMTLEKRIYKIGVIESKENLLINKNACKHQNH